ncbi:MAG: MoxR family ATPase [Promethearchaeota archaeon]|nr:MAG: MoxR family ATPase [Candidatus Lokiarchaeota archaeon]
MTNTFDKFSGTDDYIVSPELKDIVNVAVALERPLLVRGEPGTGKTLLAHSIAKSLGKRLITWNIKSTTKAKDGLYVYDTVQRLYDSRFGDKDVSNIKNYIHLGKLGEAFASEEQLVLLIDEIDKADVEFPNDLLNELDEMSFYIHETMETTRAKQRPIVIITSNNEKELPDAFLRRCIFHYIEFPDAELMEKIVYVHHPKVRKELIWQCLEKFYKLRKVDYLRKKPSTSELIDWIGVLIKAGITEKELSDGFPFLGTLIKKEQDYEMLTKEKGFSDERSFY